MAAIAPLMAAIGERSSTDARIRNRTYAKLNTTIKTTAKLSTTC